MIKVSGMYPNTPGACFDHAFFVNSRALATRRVPSSHTRLAERMRSSRPLAALAKAADYPANAPDTLDQGRLY